VASMQQSRVVPARTRWWNCPRYTGAGWVKVGAVCGRGKSADATTRLVICVLSEGASEVNTTSAQA
jgi:hypothetical protein